MSAIIIWRNIMQSKTTIIYATAIISLAVIISTLILTRTWSSNYRMNQTISVTGSATKTFQSDLGYLRTTIQTKAATAREAFSTLESQKPALINFFQERGFEEDSLHFFPANNYSQEEFDENGRPTGQILSWNYSQRVEVRSPDVQLIQNMSLELSTLVNEGIYVMVEQPEYYFSGLDTLKVHIQADAARNAMERAQFIADATGKTLGNMTGARMGVLQITPVNSNQVSNYGINDVSSIEKEITGVVTATFLIQ